MHFQPFSKEDYCFLDGPERGKGDCSTNAPHEMKSKISNLYCKKQICTAFYAFPSDNIQTGLCDMCLSKLVLLLCMYLFIFLRSEVGRDLWNKICKEDRQRRRI